MKGLLLVGGKSSRMGQDKAEMILRDSLTQKERGIQLLQQFCSEVHISTRDENNEPNSLPDAFGNIGPLGAIASAQQAHPDSTWLILACDMPLLEPQHLEALVSARNPNHLATCFASAHDGLPEPLCTIWEPASQRAVRQALENDKPCPRHVLTSLDIQLLPSPGLWPLANSNTEEDLIEIQARLNQTTTSKTVTLNYFAHLRELAGTSSETIQTDCETAAGLYDEIRAKYQIPLKRKSMMVAVNDEFSDWSHRLTTSDEIVFMPPVVGG